MVIAGAIAKGTGPFNGGTRSGDAASKAAYTRLDGMSDQISGRLNGLSPPGADPGVVADAIAPIIAMPAGAHFARWPVCCTTPARKLATSRRQGMPNWCSALVSGVCPVRWFRVPPLTCRSIRLAQTANHRLWRLT
jgi:hypothetical protein